jgi:acyl dehydratase
MNSPSVPPRGLYFEEFEVGKRFKTPRRTVTEGDIVAFAGLSGDFEAIHTDAEYAASTPFGQRVAYGLLGLSMVSGLATRSGFIEGTVLAFREIKNWKFTLPVFIGDSIHAEIEVADSKPIPRLGGGSLGLKIAVKNQADEVVMRGRWIVLVKSRPDD